MSYLDAHAHFADEGYSFPGEWEKICAAGVKRVILAGDTLAHTALHRDFCKEHAGAYFAAGVHPSETADFSADTLKQLRALAEEEKCVAIGEIGLDYHYPDTDKEAQRAAFEAQLLLAEELNLPVQIHSRDAAQDTLSLLTSMRAHLKHGFLLHCYSYSAELMPAFEALGGYFSFGGVVCFKNAKRAVECVCVCRRDRLLTETDSPYLSPFRGEKNSPANIPVILARIAALRGEGEEECKQAVYENAKRLFYKLK